MNNISNFLLKNLTKCCIFFLIFIVNKATSQIRPEGFSIYPVIEGLKNPTDFAFAPDGRIFITEQGGEVKVVKDNKILENSLISLSVDKRTERGLQSIVLDPNFNDNNYIYLFYTLKDKEINRVSRFTLKNDTAIINSQKIIFNSTGLLKDSPFHNGGSMSFGKDNKLFIATGDARWGPGAQSLNHSHGKLLRINTDGTAPEDNPFFESDSKWGKYIWAIGLRNPFSMDIDTISGKIFINDVGENNWEEINDASIPGKNFGWAKHEGKKMLDGFDDPIFAYPHIGNTTYGCAITGGTFFNPTSTNYPDDYLGKYFFLDYCNGWINTLDIKDSTDTLFSSKILNFDSYNTVNSNSFTVKLKTGQDGCLYFLSRLTKSLYKISYTENKKPQILKQPKDHKTTVSSNTTFKVYSSGDSLDYFWFKDGELIPNESKSILKIQSATFLDSGSYKVQIKNSYDSVSSLPFYLTVEEFNHFPENIISLPDSGFLYKAGDTIFFQGEAFDQEDGQLTKETFSWRVDFHHEDHIHDSPPIAVGEDNGFFIIPTNGETSPDVWYRIYFSSTDYNGNETEIFKDVYPNITTITLNTEPENGWVILDEYNEQQAPFSFKSVIGLERNISTLENFEVDSIKYWFSHWSDDGKRSHNITVPEGDTTIISAIFKPRVNITLQTNPDSLMLIHNDSMVVSPYNFTAFVGDSIEIGTIEEQETGKFQHVFSKWIHEENLKNEIVVPENDTIYTAVFESFILGNEDDLFFEEFKLFPNPVKNELRIRFKLNGKINRTLNFQIIDPLGRVIENYSYLPEKDGATTINVNQLSSGLFLLKCWFGNNTVIKKFIISK